MLLTFLFEQKFIKKSKQKSLLYLNKCSETSKSNNIFTSGLWRKNYVLLLCNNS